MVRWARLRVAVKADRLNCETACTRFFFLPIPQALSIQQFTLILSFGWVFALALLARLRR
jgi:hypothetical protein